jgi:hypothetical protein
MFKYLIFDTSYIFKTSYDKKLPKYFSNVNSFAETHLKTAIEDKKNGLFETNGWIIYCLY